MEEITFVPLYIFCW